MDIKQIRDERDAIARSIAEHTTIAINRLAESTGIGIVGITVQLINITDLKSVMPRYMVGGVDIEMERI